MGLNSKQRAMAKQQETSLAAVKNKKATAGFFHGAAGTVNVHEGKNAWSADGKKMAALFHSAAGGLNVHEGGQVWKAEGGAITDTGSSKTNPPAAVSTVTNADNSTTTTFEDGSSITLSAGGAVVSSTPATSPFPATAPTVVSVTVTPTGTVTTYSDGSTVTTSATGVITGSTPPTPTGASGAPASGQPCGCGKMNSHKVMCFGAGILVGIVVTLIIRGAKKSAAAQ